MTLLGKSQIVAADDLPIEDIHVPEWGGLVRLRTMTCAEMDGVLSDVQKRRKDGTPIDISGFRARLVQLSIVNGDGSLLFTKEDIPELQKKSSLVMERIAKVAMHLNGMDKSDVEAVAGNLSTTANSGSGSS